MPDNVELIYFDGCPHAGVARENLRAALEAANLPAKWDEWNQYEPNAPQRVKQYGSPTILVNGRDVTGQESGVAASACRADGAPSVDTIRAALGTT